MRVKMTRIGRRRRRVCIREEEGMREAGRAVEGALKLQADGATNYVTLTLDIARTRERKIVGCAWAPCILC